ncbi:MAG: hypothetical protein LBH46_03190 [Rickettsiales bacterium]|jgi:hypothetical protein|nr:hypothetical protein [Rickettsiales bacterium]
MEKYYGATLTVIGIASGLAPLAIIGGSLMDKQWDDGKVTNDDNNSTNRAPNIGSNDDMSKNLFMENYYSKETACIKAETEVERTQSI